MLPANLHSLPKKKFVNLPPLSRIESNALLNDQLGKAHCLKNVQKFIQEEDMATIKGDRSPPQSRHSSLTTQQVNEKDDNCNDKKVKNEEKSARTPIGERPMFPWERVEDEEEQPCSSSTIKKFPKLKLLRRKFQSMDHPSGERLLDVSKLNVVFNFFNQRSSKSLLVYFVIEEMGNLQVLNKFKSLTLKEKPPKLTREGIRSLLQQSLKLARNDDPKIFLKTLVVSKKFLSIARHYPVYTLVVTLRANGNFYLSFGKNIETAFQDVSNLKEAAKLSEYFYNVETAFQGINNLEKTAKLSECFYNRTFDLMKLLDPKHFYFDLERVEESSEALRYYEALFRLVRNAKIGLKLPAWRFHFYGLKRARILNRLAPYLNLLECEFDVLKDANVVSTLNLDYLTIYSTLNKDAFKSLLHHNIRKIYVSRVRIEREINESDLKEVQANSILQFLRIRCFIGSYKSLSGFFNLLKHHCPHLRSFESSFDFRDAILCPEFGHMSMEEVLEKLPAIHENLKSLQYDSPSSLSSLLIFATSKFRISPDSTFDHNWPDKLKHHEGFKNIVCCIDGFGFKGFAFKSEYGFFILLHIVEIEFAIEIGSEDEYEFDDYYGND